MDQKYNKNKMLAAISKTGKNKRIFNAMDCMRTFNQDTIQKIDYHEFSYFLDSLRELGFIKFEGIHREGLCQYSLF